MKNSVKAAIAGSLIFGFFFILIASIFRAINISRFGTTVYSNIIIEGLIVSVVFFVFIYLFMKYGKKEKL